MTKEGRLRKSALGAFAGLSIVGLIASCAYSIMYISINDPWLSYQPGRSGLLGSIVYVIAITSLVSLAIYLVAFIFILCDCCQCFKKLLIILGTIVWAACFICEIIFVVFNNWNLSRYIQDKIGGDLDEYAANFNTSVYAYYDSDKAFDMAKIPGIPMMATRSAPSYGQITKMVFDKTGKPTGRVETVSMPVCFFESESDKKAFKPKQCIGKWDGGKIEKYINKIEDLQDEDSERQKDPEKYEKWYFRWILYNVIMYSQTGAYGIMPIFLGVQGGAFVFGCLYVIMSICACCCGCCCCCCKDRSHADVSA